jgi:hypothetical protein
MKGVLQVGTALVVTVAIAMGCSREPAGFEIQPGTDVSVEKTNGLTVAGRLVEVQAQEVVLQAADGQQTRVPRAEIRAVRAVTPTAARTDSPAAPAAPPAPQAPVPNESDRTAPPRDPSAAGRDAARSADAAAAAADGARRTAEAPSLSEYREVTIPAGTVIPIELTTSVGSATSSVEDQVRGRVRRSIHVAETEAIPAGATVLGTVTEATRSGRVKGRARVAFRFTSIDMPGDAERVSIRTGLIAREAEGTQKKDAAKIGGAAAAGAVIGGIIGGGDGAAKGAAIGGGAGTGVVLSTRGKEVSLPAGTAVSTKLTEPVTIRVRTR